MALELQPVLLTEFAAAPAKAPAVRGHRSKGCITCRNRKVKCDERRPTCSRCEKGKHKCLGYDKPLVFVAQEFGSPKATPSQAPTALISKKRETTPSTHYSASSPSTLASDDDWAFILPKKKALSPARQVCRSVPLNAFKDEIVICHLLERFSIGLGPSMMGAADAPTMTAVLMSQDAKSNAYISGLGLAEAFFGRVQKVYGMVDHSAELYGQALRSLRDDLQMVDKTAARAKAYMNLWTCVFLGLYEMVSTSGASNWMQHSHGLGALTQLLGPEAFQSVVAKSILEMNRATVAMAHMVDRKRCFLEQPEWQSVPWQNDTEPRWLNSHTVDILCDIPGLMEDIDTISKKESQGIDVMQERFLVQDKLLHRVQRIGDLVWQWDLLNPLACWEVPTNLETSVSLDEDGQPLFDSVLHYENVDRACEVLYLNAVRLLLYALCDEAKLPEVYVQAVVGSQQAGPHANPLLLPGQGDRIAHALEICRTVDYMMTCTGESRGALVMLFPLRVAWGHLKDVPEMAAWVGRVMQELSSTKGLKIGEHVLQIDSVTQE